MTPDAARRPEVHLSIDVPDLAAGLRFYTAVCGFRETARPFPKMAILDANNLTVCLHEKPSGSPSSGEGSQPRDYGRHWTPVHLDLHVTDFESRSRAWPGPGGSSARSAALARARPRSVPILSATGFASSGRPRGLRRISPRRLEASGPVG